jgi:glycosyltransferase involved in cell wall biosynthesis
MRKLSVVIITFNEEQNIKRCLESLYEIADDIVVLDAYSTDHTEAVCFKYKVNFVQKDWQGYSAARNYANSLALYDFILTIDADEVLSKELTLEIAALKKMQNTNAYKFNRLTDFCGKWIKHSGWFPDWKIRVFDRRTARWEGLVHEHLVFDKGVKIERLKGLCWHYSYSNLAQFESKTIQYAKLTAQSDFQNGKRKSFYGLYIKPIIKFIICYIFKLGFLDGAEGLLIAKMTARAVLLRNKFLAELAASKES